MDKNTNKLLPVASSSTNLIVAVASLYSKPIECVWSAQSARATDGNAMTA